MNYRDALDFFSRLEFHGIKLGLHQTRELAKFADNPQEKLKFIHVAGTNGKGTVSAMLASALSATGFKTGLYTSPHLVSPRERFRINGTAISEADFAKFAKKISIAVSKMKASGGGQATYFEAATIMAFLCFSAQKVDFVVLETGMGGRLDSTNIVSPELSVITSIGYDHRCYLGNTIKEITREKAGIIKRNKPVFCGANISPAARREINKTARETSSRVIFYDEKASIIDGGCFASKKEGKFTGQILKYKGQNISIPIAGSQQAKNIPLVCEIIRYLAEKYKFSFDDAIKGLAKTSVCARLSVLPDFSLLDGAHNEQAVCLLVENIKTYFGNKKFTVIFSCLKDKRGDKMIKNLSEIAKIFYFVPIKGTERAQNPERFAAVAKRLRIKTKIFNSAKEAIEEKSGATLITGSFFLAGEVLRLYFTDEKIINWSLS
jgi:dihydrofolate synthase/folylpolyglutamate synthase